MRGLSALQMTSARLCPLEGHPIDEDTEPSFRPGQEFKKG